MGKIGRNDPCPCGSGKKFKKCCEPKTSNRSIGQAEVITSSNKMTSFFQQRVSPPPSPKPEQDPPQNT